MISFDQLGNLTPYMLIQLPLALLRHYFVEYFPKSATRQNLYSHFDSYVHDLKASIDQYPQQWLGGSFISTKLNPNDIDCVNLVLFNEALEQNIDPLIPYLLIGGSRDTYYVDGHLIAVYLEYDERYESITIPSINYLQHFLMHDRNANPRGIIELVKID